jgi:hypothetical protein
MNYRDSGAPFPRGSRPALPPWLIRHGSKSLELIRQILYFDGPLGILAEPTGRANKHLAGVLITFELPVQPCIYRHGVGTTIPTAHISERLDVPILFRPWRISISIMHFRSKISNLKFWEALGRCVGRFAAFHNMQLSESGNAQFQSKMQPIRPIKHPNFTYCSSG